MKMKQMLYTFPFHFSDIASSHSVDEVSSQKTVITVPVEFNSHQREIVSKCASNAGFNVSQVISEPAAAILGMISRCICKNNTLILDLFHMVILSFQLII